MFYDDNIIYNTEMGEDDPDLGKLYYTKRINRYSGEFIFYATFLKGDIHKTFLDELFKEKDKQNLEFSDREIIKVLSDQIRRYADGQNTIKANCSVEKQLKQKF